MLSQQAVSLVEKKPAGPPPSKKREKGQGRMILPDTLRREVIVIEPEQDLTGCILIGQQVTEVLEYTPAEFYVKQYIRRKYACPHGEGVVIGSLPERIIEKGIPSESVLAQMTVDKYVFGMPLHRQLDKYRRLGVNVPASTASDWLMKSWQQLAPLGEVLKLLVLHQKYLQVDETPLKVLDRDHKNGIHQGYVWVYLAPRDQLVWFDYQKGRNATGPQQMLKAYEGILQTDGYGVYESLFGQHDKNYARLLPGSCSS